MLDTSDYPDNLARLDMSARLAFPPRVTANPAPVPIRFADGALAVHRTFGRPDFWSVSLPCGAALGRYRRFSDAKAAARLLSSLVIDEQGQTVAAVFGSRQAARDAYDTVRHLIA